MGTVVVHSSQISTKRIAFKPADGQPVKTIVLWDSRNLLNPLVNAGGASRGKRENKKISNNEDLRVPSQLNENMFHRYEEGLDRQRNVQEVKAPPIRFVEGN